ncbi:MAG: tRNA (guanine(46)-N(7))-methyltransferase TrmB [Pseudomonadota bacterium]
MADAKHPDAPWRNFYGRTRGKTLKPAQARDLEVLLPQVQLKGVSWEDNGARVPLDLGIFEGRPIWLEIGFGGGEHLAAMAEAHPDVAFIGCEPFLNGVAMLLGKIRRSGLANIWIHPGDARDLFDVLPTSSLSRAYLLYPDPWPKARHHRRRFVTQEHLGPLARSMGEGSTFYLATDIPDYVRQALEEVPKAGFSWDAERPSSWREPWGGWHRTRYEAKALREGRVPHYLTFTRGSAKGPPASPSP